MDERWFGRCKYNSSDGITWASRISGTTNNLWFLSTKKNPMYSPHHFLNEEQMTEIKSFFFSIQFNVGVKWRFKRVNGATAKFIWNWNYRLVETRMGSP